MAASTSSTSVETFSKAGSAKARWRLAALRDTTRTATFCPRMIIRKMNSRRSCRPQDWDIRHGDLPETVWLYQVATNALPSPGVSVRRWPEA